LSHKFRAPASIHPQERRDNRMVDLMALQIQDQAQLDKLLEGASPAMREAMLERVTPYLDFTPETVATKDCPNCGLRRGSVIDHECLNSGIPSALF